MEVLPGTKKNSSIYVYVDYTYIKDSRYDNVFRCRSRQTTKCRGSVMLDNNIVHVLHEHNHPKLNFVKEQIAMKEEMLRLSHSTYIGLKEIFDSVCRG